MGKVYAVGVGPGSPKYVTEIVKDIVKNCDIIIGYKYTLKTIEDLTKGKEIYEITMSDQEESYQKILPKMDNKTLVIPFTGDVNFSESEVVDRLIEIFGEVEIIPGISSIQVAASRAKIPLDKMLRAQNAFALSRILCQGQKSWRKMNKNKVGNPQLFRVNAKLHPSEVRRFHLKCVLLHLISYG